ncbi:MAG: hypothetical protein JXA77_03695 [Bacteroidales bacterium]|nr:hypothetical protein [Bacteroidales bacterium]
MLRLVTNSMLTCLLLIATTGLAVSKHYCGSELVSVEIADEAESCCTDGECCHTEAEFFQLDADFLASTLPVDFRSMFTVDLFLNTPSEEISPLRDSEYFTTLLYPDDPPPRKMQMRMALNQVYRL